MILTNPITLPASKMINTMTALIGEMRFNDTLQPSEIVNDLVDMSRVGKVDFGKGIIYNFKYDTLPVKDLSETSTATTITKPAIGQETITIDNYKFVPISLNDIIAPDCVLNGNMLNTFFSFAMGLMEDTAQDDRLDFSSLTAFANGDPEAEQSILKMFREETDKHIALLKQALQEEDQELSARIAHKIIPLFRMSGANELVQRLRLLEKREIADEDAWRRLLSEVIEQVSWLVQTLQQETVQRN